MKLAIIELYFIVIKKNNLLSQNLFVKFMMQIKFVLAIYHLPFHIVHTNLQVKSIFLIRNSSNGFFLIVNTTEAGDGHLSVKIKQNGSRITHEQTRMSGHVYEILFIPETSDECIVSITFNGENIRKFVHLLV